MSSSGLACQFGCDGWLWFPRIPISNTHKGNHIIPLIDIQQ